MCIRDSCYPYQTDEDYRDACIEMQEYLGFAPNYTRFLQDFYAIQNGDTLLAEDVYKRQVRRILFNLASSVDATRIRYPFCSRLCSITVAVDLRIRNSRSTSF